MWAARLWWLLRYFGHEQVAVPFTTTVDATGGLRAPEELRALFAEAGATPDKRVVAYCGGGIAAAIQPGGPDPFGPAPVIGGHAGSVVDRS